jgi:uncharacterized Tic20 family protein
MSDPQDQETVNSAVHSSSPQDDRLWGALAHLGGIFFFLPTLIIYLGLRNRGTTTRIESKEALNWQITLAICWIVVDFLVLILGGIYVAAATAAGATSPASPTLFLYGVWAVLWAVNVVFSVRGFVIVNGGRSYRYPFAFRFIK